MTYEAAVFRERFEKHRYAVITGFLSPSACQAYYRYLSLKAVAGRFENPTGDRQVVGSCAEYADPLMETLLATSLSRFANLTGIQLDPSYSYCRVYQRGSVLAPHRDRPACEISATICLGYPGGRPWPLFLRGPRGVVKCTARQGDAVLYRGCEIQHWREPLDGDHQAQVFLHYVDRNGPYAAWKYDKRELLGVKRA